jgi:hypothetical protein
LHRKIDLYGEIPAFSTVLITGIAMTDTAQLHGWYLIGVLSGTIAVAINIWCVRQVFGRSVAARADNRERVSTFTRRIIGSGLVGAPFAALALTVGVMGLA